MEHLQLEKPKLSASGSPSPLNGKGCVLTLTGIAIIVSSLFLGACEGSRPRRLYESGKESYEHYEETGDPTWLIVFVVGLVILGIVWLMNNKNKK